MHFGTKRCHDRFNAAAMASHHVSESENTRSTSFGGGELQQTFSGRPYNKYNATEAAAAVVVIHTRLAYITRFAPNIKRNNILLNILLSTIDLRTGRMCAAHCRRRRSYWLLLLLLHHYNKRECMILYYIMRLRHDTPT